MGGSRPNVHSTTRSARRIPPYALTGTKGTLRQPSHGGIGGACSGTPKEMAIAQNGSSWVICRRRSLVATFAADKGIVDQSAAKMAVVEVVGD